MRKHIISMMEIEMEKKYYEFANSLFDELQSIRQSSSYLDELFLDGGISYEKSFEEALFRKLSSCQNGFMREDLGKVAECFREIAENNGSDLPFMENVYEEWIHNEEKYIDKNEIITLSRFLNLYLKQVNKASKSMKNNQSKPKFLFLSFIPNPEPGQEEGIDGKGEALLRAINKINELDCSSVTLPYENRVKEYFVNRERKDVNWIASLDDTNALQNEDFDFIFLVNPKLCSINWEEIDNGSYIDNGIESFSPVHETVEKYSKALKPGGRMFFVIETITAGYELLKEVQSEAHDNKLYLESVSNFYSFEPNLNIYEIAYNNYRNSKLAVVALQKDASGTENIKFLNIDNTMDDDYIEKLIGAKPSERLKYKKSLAFFPYQEFFSDVSDFEEQTDKIYYRLQEKYFEFFYQDGENASYVKLVKKLYDDNYSDDVKSSLSEIDWRYINDLARLAESLGIYYSGYQDLVHLKRAKYFLEIAMWCQMDVGSSLEMTENIIAMKESGQSPFAIIKTQFTNLFPIDLNENNFVVLFSDIEQILKTEFGEIYWNRLQPETRIYLQTSVFSFLHFLNSEECLQSKFDYSGMISLLMRALELELKKRFCTGYLNYLCEHCPNPYNYLKMNGLTNKFKENVKDIKGIVKFVKEESSMQLRYISYDGNNIEDGTYYFSMGKLHNFTGYKEERNSKEVRICIDTTFLEYLKLKMNDGAKKVRHESQKDRSERDKKIKVWVSKISKDVESLRYMRNDASHGGTVLNIEAAMQAFDKLILSKKVLKELVVPF